MAEAQANPDQKFSVIVQPTRKQASATSAFSTGEGGLSESVQAVDGELKRRFRYVTAVHAEVTGRQLVKLSKRPNIASVVRDEPLALVGDGDWSVDDPEDAGLWRSIVAAPSLWDRPGLKAPQAPAVAIFDSGIDASKAKDFGARVIARANFSSLEPNAVGDPSGHGTMVAGIAAGNDSVYPGVARNAPLVDVRVASSKGQAMTSDIVAAVDWVLANKDRYNIRVANFSLVGNSSASFRFDPLDKAVEKLWLNGIVVVAAAGNNGNANGPAGIGAPANDPFVITVGALDTMRTASVADDKRASWSAYGSTADGFMKPELAAPGRWIVGPVPSGSRIHRRKPGRVVAPGYMWMSGTSFAAPIVAGAAAQMIARNPSLTPDQVKGALMLTARYLRAHDPGAGVGEVDIAAAAKVSSPPNPNANLYQFVVNGTFDAEAWTSHVKVNANWTASNWTASNWTASNWTASNWVSSNWVASNWVASNWVSSNWTASNWTASNWTVATEKE